MKGWYCIYECSQNQWLLENGYWMNDRDYYKKPIGAKHAIITTNGYNPNLPQIEIIDTETTLVLIDNGAVIDPNQIMKFETIVAAEEFLLKTFSMGNGQFYSIRKIYF
jgi:hypothetical protein